MPLEAVSITMQNTAFHQQRRLGTIQRASCVRRADRCFRRPQPAVELGYLGNPAAWRLKSLSDEVEEGGESAVFLRCFSTRLSERKLLLRLVRLRLDSFGDLGSRAGPRPKMLAATVVADFDGQTLRLTHRNGGPVRLRPGTWCREPRTSNSPATR
jgi:hypothetical protein